MKVKFLTAAIMCAALIASALPAQADNIADCEILLMEMIPDESGQGGAQIASYRPAGDFISSIYNEDLEIVTHVGDLPIRALMCQRNDVVPVETDYAILATGVPFILSQDFDSSETDSMTVFWKEDKFDYVYKGHPMTDDAEAKWQTRLEDFSTRDHGLSVTEDEDDTNLDEEMSENTDSEEIEDAPKSDPEADTDQKSLTPEEQEEFK